MKHLFFSKTLHVRNGVFKYILPVICWMFFLPFALKAQTLTVEEKADTVETPRRAIGLVGAEAVFVQKALNQIPKDSLAYIAIHGDKNLFKIFEDNTWKSITHRSVAKWIVENRAYDGKTIVLLSCSNLTSAEKLSITLANFDQKAKKAIHKIIAWEGKVDLYENGRILAMSTCKLFQAGKSSLVSNPPKGTNNVTAGKKIRLGGIDISAEEAAGGHSIARHGSHLTLRDMEERVLGTSSLMGQSRSALKFISNQIHEDATSAAFAAHKSDIEAHFSTPGTDYMKYSHDFGSIVGEGYTNTTTRNAPTSLRVTTTKVEIAVIRDASDPRGFRIDSSYPLL
jgi:hypothetical protein